jgi:integrase
MDGGENMVQMEHPNKGKKLDVEPIREVVCIKRIEKMLAANPRDLLLFVLGINNGLRLKDLLNVICAQLRNTSEGDYFEVRETKTGKTNVMVVNAPVAVAVKKYFKAYPDRNGDDYVFFSQKTGRAITSAYGGDLIQQWCRDAGCKGKRFGAATLRKTWGYMARTQHGVAWSSITARYNHSSPSVTRAYLGFSRDEIVELLRVPITGGK